METSRQRFDAAGMVAAFTAARDDRGLSLASAAGELNVAPSTIRKMATGSIMEMDGVLALTAWLGLGVESFYREPRETPAHPRKHRIDAPAVYTALDAKRRAEDLTWAALAALITLRSGVPIGAAGLTRLKGGGRMDLYHTLAIAEWLGVSVASLTRYSAF